MEGGAVPLPLLLPSLFCLLPTFLLLCAIQKHFRFHRTIQLHFPLLFRFRGTIAQCCSEGVVFLHYFYDACENLGPIQKVLGYCVPWKRAENWFLTLLWPQAASQPRSQHAYGCVFVETNTCSYTLLLTHFLTVLQGKVERFMVNFSERGYNEKSNKFKNHWYISIFCIFILFFFSLAHI